MDATLIIWWLFFVVVTPIVAATRKRRPVIWFFNGFLFGFFALVALLIMGRGTVGMKKCSACLEFIKEDASVCKHCGYKSN